MADYTGADIFSAAKRDDASGGAVSNFVAARLAEAEARQSEGASSAPIAAPATKIPSLIAAVMRGNAQVQSDTRGKEFKQKVDQTLARVKITEHGDGTVDVKGAPAEFFQGRSMVAEGKANVEEPMARVDQALGTGPAAPEAPTVPPSAVVRPEEVSALEEMYTTNDSAWGQRLPRPYEVAEMVKTPEGVRKLTYLLGGNEQHARVNIERAKKENSRTLLADNLTRNLVKMHAGLYETNKTAINDSQQNARSATEITKEKRRTFEAFLGNNLVDIGTEDEAVATARERVTGSGLPWGESDEKEVRSAYRGQQRKLTNAATQTVAQRITAMKDDDVKGYSGDAARWIADNEGALGVTFSPAQRSSAIARFTGIEKEVRAAERKVEIERNRAVIQDNLAARREVRQIAAAERANELEERKAKKEKQSVIDAAMKQRDEKVNASLKKLDDLDTQIRKNSLRFANDEAGTAEKAELQRQNAMLVSQIPVEQDKLYLSLGYKVVPQERYDEMIALGLTPQQIADEKIRVSKQSAKKP